MKQDNYILVCDDSEFILQVAAFALEAEGFNVVTAKNTAEITHRLEAETKPSLVLLDLNIPDDGGESIIQQLKSKDETKNIPVVLFSASENLQEIAAKLGAQGFLKKPFDNEELKKIVTRYVSVVKD